MRRAMDPTSPVGLLVGCSMYTYRGMCFPLAACSHRLPHGTRSWCMLGFTPIGYRLTHGPSRGTCSVGESIITLPLPWNAPVSNATVRAMAYFVVDPCDNPFWTYYGVVHGTFHCLPVVSRGVTHAWFRPMKYSRGGDTPWDHPCDILLIVTSPMGRDIGYHGISHRRQNIAMRPAWNQCLPRHHDPPWGVHGVPNGMPCGYTPVGTHAPRGSNTAWDTCTPWNEYWWVPGGVSFPWGAARCFIRYQTRTTIEAALFFTEKQL